MARFCEVEFQSAASSGSDLVGATWRLTCGIVEQFRAGPFFEVAIFVLASRKVRRCNGSRAWLSDTEQDLFVQD